MKKGTVSALALFLAVSLFVIPTLVFGDGVCPGECQNVTECHNPTGGDCHNGCRTQNNRCFPTSCICPTGITKDPWAVHSESVADAKSVQPRSTKLAESGGVSQR